MNNKIKEILDRINNYPEKLYCLNENEKHLLLDYITNLQEKVNQYENPDDMTLFYMWLDTKAKDKIRKLQEENKQLKTQLQQKENIIKEVRNYIKEESWFCYKDNEEVIDRTPINKLLEILGDNDE